MASALGLVGWGNHGAALPLVQGGGALLLARDDGPPSKDPPDRFDANRARREELERKGEEIAHLSCVVGIATHRLLTCIRTFDVGYGWHDQGALSCAHWLSFRTGLSMVTAREKVRVAHALGELSLIDEAFATGQLSYSQVRALVRVATHENEAALLELAKAATGSQLERICRAYGTIGTPVEEPERWVSVRQREDGVSQVVIQVTDDEAEILVHGYRAEVKRVHEAERARIREARRSQEAASTTPAHAPFRFRQVDAAIALARASISGLLQHPDPIRRRPDFEVMVVVEAQGKAGHLESGTPIAPTTIERITCDAPLVPVSWKRSEGALDLGRRTRTLSPALERALRMRDGGCRFPGCTHHLWTHAHHIVHWSKGGETNASNLILLCDVHHRLVHEGGFKVTGTATALEFRDRQGRKLAERKPLTRAEADLLLQRWIDEEGLSDRKLPIPNGDGSKMDLGWTIAALAQRGPPRGRKFDD